MGTGMQEQCHYVSHLLARRPPTISMIMKTIATAIAAHNLFRT